MQESKDYRAAQKLSKGEEGTATFKEVKKTWFTWKVLLESWANQNYRAIAGLVLGQMITWTRTLYKN